MPPLSATLSLVPAFENISIYSNFSGDDNGNNSAYAEFRQVGTQTWLPSVELSVDRRAEVSRCEYVSGGSLYYTTNDYPNQWRGIVFWLQPNTQYEVRVTYTDSDGISGTNQVTGTVTTRNDNPPSNGTNYYVSTSGNDSNNGLTQPTAFRTIQKAANIVVAGDIVNVLPGTYQEMVTVTRSGQVNNYITFTSSDLNNKAIIDAQRTRDSCFLINGADYIRIKGFDLRNARWEGDRHGNVQLNNGADGVFIEDNVITGIGGAWRAGAIVILSGNSGQSGTPCYNVTIQGNYMEDGNPTQGRTERDLIAAWNPGGSGYIIRNNTLTNSPNVEDGIATSDDLKKDMFVYNNYFSAGSDDCFEAEGEDINLAVWGNTFVNPWPSGGSFCRMAMGLCPVTVGPAYIFRNVMLNFNDSTLKLGNSTGGRIFLWHNTIYGTGPGTFGNNNLLTNMVSRNNIWHTKGARCGYMSGPSDWIFNNDWDYDLWFQRAYQSGDPQPSPQARFSIRWDYYNGQTGELCQTWDIWRNFSGEEAHGLVADPQFNNIAGNDFTLQSSSPAIDKGTIIVGINDANSPWPYQGSTPDIGAYEYDSGAPTNSPPVAVNDAYSTNEDTVLNVAAPGVLSNDSDPDGDTLTAIKVTNPSHGTVTLNSNGSFTYTPSANYNGTDSFTYQANDGQANSNTATVTITINAVNDAPVAVNDAYSTNKDIALNVTAPGVLGNDTDAEGTCADGDQSE